jgi:hypothetical protein
VRLGRDKDGVIFGGERCDEHSINTLHDEASTSSFSTPVAIINVQPVQILELRK